MRSVTLVTFVAAALIAACVARKEDARTSPVPPPTYATWLSEGATVSQRLAYVRDRISAGMDMTTVQTILGPPSKAPCRHNPGLPTAVPPEQHPPIQWWLDYGFRDGKTIRINFLQVMDVDRFDTRCESACVVSISTNPMYYTRRDVDGRATHGTSFVEIAESEIKLEGTQHHPEPYR